MEDLKKLKKDQLMELVDTYRQIKIKVSKNNDDLRHLIAIGKDNEDVLLIALEEEERKVLGLERGLAIETQFTKRMMSKAASLKALLDMALNELIDS